MQSESLRQPQHLRQPILSKLLAVLQAGAATAGPCRIEDIASSVLPLDNQNSGARTVEAIQKLGETEELLMKRRTLLEKKCAQEAERAREQMKAKNKRGKTLPDLGPCPA
ncbi:hypothetical protein WJX84_007644 [Apatococcus fuscideae]|uniref:Uncharacterized protein n=1 Tax=Apatococcus fuscideae TaxID=2026836 RepID=A0AAW1SPJ3_9CHLO